MNPIYYPMNKFYILLIAIMLGSSINAQTDLLEYNSNRGHENLKISNPDELWQDIANSEVTESLGFEPPCELPYTIPTGTSVSLNLSQTGFSTSWNAIPGQIGCQVQLRINDVEGLPILGSRIVSGENADSFLIPANVFQTWTNYSWRVRCGCSTNPLIVGDWSSWQIFFTGFIGNLSEQPSTIQLSSGLSFVSFRISQPEMTNLEVYDITGKMVEAIFSGVAQPNADYRFEFNGNNLPNGIYIYRLTTESEVKTEKFMISK